jgi:hypothetical protein
LLWEIKSRYGKSIIAFEVYDYYRNHWLLWTSSVAMDVPGCDGSKWLLCKSKVTIDSQWVSHWLLWKVTGCYEKTSSFEQSDGYYGKSMVVKDVSGC